MTCILKTNKILLKEIKDELDIRRDKPCSWIQKLNAVNNVDSNQCNL